MKLFLVDSARSNQKLQLALGVFLSYEVFKDINEKIRSYVKQKDKSCLDKYEKEAKNTLPPVITGDKHEIRDKARIEEYAIRHWLKDKKTELHNILEELNKELETHAKINLFGYIMPKKEIILDESKNNSKNNIFDRILGQFNMYVRDEDTTTERDDVICLANSDPMAEKCREAYPFKNIFLEGIAPYDGDNQYHFLVQKGSLFGLYHIEGSYTTILLRFLRQELAGIINDTKPRTDDLNKYCDLFKLYKHIRGTYACFRQSFCDELQNSYPNLKAFIDLSKIT